MAQQINLHQPIMGATRRLFSAGALAVSLAVFAACLGALSAFAALRVRAAERTLQSMDERESLHQASTLRGLAALHATASMETLDGRARELAAEIAEKEQVLTAIRNGASDPASGFAAQLAALGRQQVEGIWLKRIVLSSGTERVALAGAATDASLVAGYLGTLSHDHTLGRARFDRLEIKRPDPAEDRAAAVFEVGKLPAFGESVQ